ncbi:unnamed protein product [Heligmosomoides polygyrus]|uniref:DRBM domain-containing protein n=1 Tax=Heligmosomoides polygyrus TaxID=6339 RepID=A0A183FTM9_HELPZ|nr:unnamed protein product [Heligmosomoides polygyrus]
MSDIDYHRSGPPLELTGVSLETPFDMADPGKPAVPKYGVEMYGFPDFVHVPAKKHYDAWSSSTRSSSGCSSSSSPNHLEELHVDIPHSSAASVASTSSTPQLANDTMVEAAPAPSFVDLQPVAPKALAPVADPTALPPTALPAEVPPLPSYPSPAQAGYQASPVAPNAVMPIAPIPIRPQPAAVEEETGAPQIAHDARFSSYAEFEEAFETWKRKCLHPFRVASSETLREPDGTVNHRFKYRYVVFHCAHYGEPRMRGIGKRPNQHYLPSGCRAMLRLNYSFAEQLLKITTLHDEHLNHEISAEMFRKVSAKLKRSSVGAPSPAHKRPKTDSPLSYSSDSSYCQSSPLTAVSPLHANTATTGSMPQNSQMSLSQTNQMASMAIALQQQQIMASLLSQQKENINLSSGLSSLGLARPQPSMMNILGMMGLQQRLLLQQPAYGLVAPMTQQVSSPPQAQSTLSGEQKPNDQEAEQKYATKNDLPAPVAMKPSMSSTSNQLEGSPRESPPRLVAEAPQVSEQAPNPQLLTSSFEESLARQDAQLMNRIAQLSSLSFWGTPSIPEYR